MPEINDIKTDAAQQEEAKELALRTAKILDSKKARDIKILCINEKTIIADYFVIAMGTSTTQVNALAGEVEFKLSEELDILPARIEGTGSGSWVLLDYNSVIVHVFSPEAKEFYKLDKLWSDADEVPFEGISD